MEKFLNEGNYNTRLDKMQEVTAILDSEVKNIYFPESLLDRRYIIKTPESSWVSINKLAKKALNLRFMTLDFIEQFL